jgi:iron complex outermembrane receptor protein
MSQPLFFACRIFSAIVSLSLLLSSATRAEDSSTSAAALKKMSLEELLNQEVTSVSRTAQRAAEVATAVDVITGEDIRRSGANNIPDALRLVRALHVAQFDSHTWGISSRGFNLTTANKMQVLMDGRNLYSPLFSGVFWDVQNYPLDDLDRIEVIRGPGATMWGANAFNGVINIISKSARDTQGALIVGGGGNEEAGFGAVRYGGQLATNSFYRLYIDYFNRDDLAYANGEDARDNFMLGQTGFRSDTQLNDVNALTVQGDYYNGIYGINRSPDGRVGGGNLLGRWTRTFSPESELLLQTYFDKTHRSQFNFVEDLDTFDIDAQHRFPIGRRHSFMYGLEYRLAHDNIQNPTATQFAFIPEVRNMQLFSAFLQDEISLIEEHLSATLGSKFEHNDFSGFEIQPSVRLAYNPATNQTIWAGVSRAVRTPTRIEVDWEVPPLISNQSRDLYKSESVIAYEAGYRIQLFRKLSYDITLFYNQYDRLRSLENIPGGPYFRNEFEGDGYGFSISQTYQPLEWWRLRLNYAYLETRLKESDNHLPLPFPGFGVETEGNDPRNLFTAHSSFNLPYNIEFDQVLRFVDELPNPIVPAYLELDLRLAWHPQQNLELALIGRNLLDKQHPELGPDSPQREEVERSVFGKVTWRF